MISFIVVIIVLIAVAFLVPALKAKEKSGDVGFDSNGPLFTPAERSFLGVLEQALDSRYRVFGKVRFGDLVKPAKGLSNANRTTARNKIDKKHVDFVVCSASDLSVVVVLELDDKSHERRDRAERDNFVDQALASAKIPVLHFSASKAYVLSEVREKLAVCLAVETSPQGASTNAAVLDEKAQRVEHEVISKPMAAKPTPLPEAPVRPVQETAAPVCPKCESVMIKRQAKTGPHAGKFFWACSAFPKCRQVVTVGET